MKDQFHEILVVEDSTTQAERLKFLLREKGYSRVSIAANGKEALGQVKKQKPRLIISDILMPVMDGYEMCLLLKRDPQFNDIPIILLTSLTDTKDIIKALQAKADYFYTKPYDEEFLISRLEYILAPPLKKKAAAPGELLELYYEGERYGIDSDPAQILSLLLSTYDNAVHKRKDLEEANKNLHLVQTHLEEINQKLHQSNKDLEQFAYTASHDLQEPLRTIGNYIGLLEKDLRESLDSRDMDFMSRVVNAVKRMQIMVAELLAFSRITTRGNPLQQRSLEGILTHALTNLKYLIEQKNARITYDPLPEVVVDETQLERVFQNLIGNGIKFCDKEIPAIHISAEKRAAEWLISCRDNGIGIEAKFYQRIFEIFQRLHTREQYSGSGMGLALVKRIIERHGGRIWVESIPQGGSTFYFTLPVPTGP